MPTQDDLLVEIHALAAGGDAVGRDEGGRAVFVPGAAPGERVRVRLRETHARWARAELVEVTRAAPSRVTPPCPLFAARACGGCQWQHVDDATQRAQKQHLVAGALRKLVAAGLELRPLLAPVAPYGWRRRARFTSRRGALGFHAPRGHEVCDVPACPQLEPALEAVLVALRAANVIRGDGEVHAVVGAGGAHVVLDAPCDPAAAAALVGQAGIVGVAWRGGAAGAPAVELEPGLLARGDDFAQASRAGNDALRALVREAVAPEAGERLLELYAGSGNFTRDLLAAGAHVTATDAHPPPALRLAVADAPARSGPTEAADLTPEAFRPRPEARSPRPALAASAARFLVGPADAVARALRGERFDGVLLDPPRTGARDVVGALAAFAPARVVYVSCDPATFARDAEHLVASGFRACWAQALDLMPQTAHVELVARFERT